MSDLIEKLQRNNATYLEKQAADRIEELEDKLKRQILKYNTSSQLVTNLYFQVLELEGDKNE